MGAITLSRKLLETSRALLHMPAPLETRPLTLESALELFDSFAAREELGFDYLSSGCEAQAHIMCTDVMAMGVQAYKAWGFAANSDCDEYTHFDPSQRLRVTLPDGRRIAHAGNDEDMKEGWRFHVTLALPVFIPGVGPEKLVFNPGIFDGPVSLEQWGRVLNVPKLCFRHGGDTYGDRLQITPFGRIPVGYIGDYSPLDGRKTKEIIKDPNHNPILVLQKLREAGPPPPRSVFPSPFRGQEYVSDSTAEVQAALPKAGVHRRYAELSRT